MFVKEERVSRIFALEVEVFIGLQGATIILLRSVHLD